MLQACYTGRLQLDQRSLKLACVNRLLQVIPLNVRRPMSIALQAGLLSCCCATAVANAPRLYSQGAYQSLTSVDPDDLAVIVGDSLAADDQVIYAAYPADGRLGAHPDTVPSRSTAETGIAEIVSAEPPYQLTLRFPQALVARRAYGLWVRNRSREWSNATSINDARPLWFSPSEVYSTQKMARMPRYLKLVGRNLSPPDATPLQLRLEGAAQYILSPDPDGSPDPTLRRYIAPRLLPNFLTPGTYKVEARVGNGPWVAVPGQSLQVLPDPKSAPEFMVSNNAFGGCRPNNDMDDTDCVAKAVDAARAGGGGTVIFDAGSWNLRPGVIVVPPFVDVQGRGADVTKIVRHDAPSTPANSAEIVLLGHNRVSDLTFSDATVFSPSDGMHPILQLGARFVSDKPPFSKPSAVSDIVISGNAFDKTRGAVVDGGSAIDHLLITYNRFGDYAKALSLGGSRFNVGSAFRIDDSIVAFNRFMPGSYIDVAARQGTMASEVGASTRMDFSDNVADGSDRHYLNSPADPPGWRAGFFWHMNNSSEMLLIADNTVNCSGDKAGDGEAISLDNNANTFAFAESQPVAQATPDTVRVTGSLQGMQNSRRLDPQTYYVGHWLRIDSGPGIGQARKISSYRIEADGGVTFSVAPAWDVAPVPTLSHVSVGRTFWQTFIVGNTADQRSPLCTKNNANSPKGGGISLWSQITDSVVADNKQHDTDGIVFMQRYIAAEQSCSTCTGSTLMASFLNIRDNIIDGEYNWNSACSLSGVMAFYGASPTPHSPPPPLGVAVSISHNRITHADGLQGGGIDILPSWFQGPPGYAKPLVAGLTIDHNDISDISGSAPKSACNYRQDDRIGIHLQGDKSLDATVLYMNRCEKVKSPLVDRAAHTLRLCDKEAAGSCECPQTK
jgi:hypothetical protein